MTIYHKKAIELKYRGYTYREISKHLNGKLSEDALKRCFQMDGSLYFDYLEYEAQQNKWTDENSRQDYKRLAAHTSKIQQSLLKQAIKSGDYRLAWDIIKDINDRAGLVVVRKSEVNVETKEAKPIDNYEQFAKELRRLGIDPGTGLRVAAPEVGKN